MYIFPPPIEPKLCTYALPNFSNIVYQFTLPQQGLFYVHISPIPLNQNCVLMLCPTLVILSINSPCPNRVLFCVHISPSH